MYNKLKKSVLILLALVLVCNLSGCGNEVGTVAVFYKPYKEAAAKSGIVASNDRYQLLWDDNLKCVLLNDLKTDKVWSSIPYDFYKLEEKEGPALVYLSSPLIIEYFETSSYQVKTATAYAECISYNTVLAQKIKNGVRITYYFERLEISVPVDYVLNENGFEARLRVNEIGENKNLVTKVSLLPYFASTPSSDDSYLVIPSGSGALMYTDEGKRNVREFSAPVYGEDFNSNENERLSVSQAVRMPFFGVKSGDDTLCVILDKGSETAEVEATAGDAEIGYSSVYASWRIRGYDYVSTQNMHGIKSIVVQYPYERLNIDYCSAKYIPLNGSNAGFIEMALLYRKTAVKRDPAENEPILYLKMLGAVQTEKLVLGVPTNVLKVLTSIDKTGEIVEKLSDECENSMAVQLMGYGGTGLNIGDIGGGFKIAGKLGGRSDYKKLSEELAKKEIGLYFDFDIVRFNGSGSGVSYYGDSARTPNGLPLTKNEYEINIYNKNPDISYRLLVRSELGKITEKLLKTAKSYGMTGISLKTLSSNAYSDYSDTEAIAKNGMSAQFESIASKIVKEGYSFAADSANAYAASVAACVFDAPISADSSDALDVDIPLYQMVYKGFVPLSGSTINLAIEPRISFLNSVSTGSGLCFSICDKAGRNSGDNYNNAAYYSEYNLIENEIKGFLAESRDFIKSVEGCSITDYKIINDSVRETVFSNGVKVTVNYSDVEYDGENGRIPAYGFKTEGVSK